MESERDRERETDRDGDRDFLDFNVPLTAQCYLRIRKMGGEGGGRGRAGDRQTDRQTDRQRQAGRQAGKFFDFIILSSAESLSMRASERERERSGILTSYQQHGVTSG